MNGSPSTNGANGDGNGDGHRDERGRFCEGNPGGPGNPHAAEVAKHRTAFFAALRADDVPGAVDIIRQAMNDTSAPWAVRLAAARELLDRAIGRPDAVPADVLQEIEELKLAAAQRTTRSWRA